MSGKRHYLGRTPLGVSGFIRGSPLYGIGRDSALGMTPVPAAWRAVLLSMGMIALSSSPWTALALGAAFALACAPRQEIQTAPPPGGTVPGNSSAIAKARADSARYPYTEADVRFMSAMIGHHSQAVLIAGWAPSHEAGQSVRTLAERIVNGQQDEIVTIERWLTDRGKPVPQAPRTGMTAGISPDSGQAQHGSPHHMMPGMLTDAQLAQLDQARGAEFDRLFLTFMIQHHKGAVTMVEELFGTPGAAQDETVFKFANDVSVDQSTEIARMEKMLSHSRNPS